MPGPTTFYFHHLPHLSFFEALASEAKPEAHIFVLRGGAHLPLHRLFLCLRVPWGAAAEAAGGDMAEAEKVADRSMRCWL